MIGSLGKGRLRRFAAPLCALGLVAGAAVPGAILPPGLFVLGAFLPSALFVLGALLPSGAAAQDLVVMLEAAPQTLDPVYATDATGVRISHQLLFDTLLTLGDDLQTAPGLAERWERLSPTRYRFHLKAGVTFHDGTPLTAEDVVYTLQSLMAPETASPYGPALREKIAAVIALDAATVEVELSAPYASILSDLALPIRSRNAGPDRPLLGTGPFRFAGRSPNEIVLERNDAYHRGPPGVARVVFKVVSDESTRLLKLRKGDIDLAINAVPLDKLARFQRPPLSRNYEVLEAPGLSYQYLGFNLEDPVLADARVRRAIAHAIDVDALIHYRQRGHSFRAVGLLSPTNPFALAGAVPPAYDPELAARLLDEAGHPLRDGRRFALNYKTSTDRSAVVQARAVQSDLRKVGIELAVRSYEWGTFYEDVQKGNFQMFSLRWVGVSDPDFFYELFHSSRMPPAGRNRVRYREPEVDRLLERGRVTADPEARREIYDAVQRALLRDLPYVSLWHNNNIAVVSRKLSGFRLHPTGGFHYLPAVRKAER